MSTLPPSSIDGRLPDSDVSERPLNGENRQAEEPAKAVQENLTGLFGDTVELTELQGQLLLSDLKSFWKSSRVSMLLLISGIVLALSSVPVLLMGLAWAVSELAGQPQSLAFVGTGLACGVLPAAGMVGVAVMRLQNDIHLLDQSRQELTRNLEWFKSTMRKHGR